MYCTFLDTINLPTEYSFCKIFSFNLFLRDAFVSGVGIDISPPSPLLFFRRIRGPSEFVLYRLNRSVSTPTNFNHSFTICPPFSASSPFVFVTLYFFASCDQLTNLPSSYDSTSNFRASLSHVILSNFPTGLRFFSVAWEFSGLPLGSKAWVRRLFCLDFSDCLLPKHLF